MLQKQTEFKAEVVTHAATATAPLAPAHAAQNASWGVES